MWSTAGLLYCCKRLASLSIRLPIYWFGHFRPMFDLKILHCDHLGLLAIIFRSSSSLFLSLFLLFLENDLLVLLHTSQWWLFPHFLFCTWALHFNPVKYAVAEELKLFHLILGWNLSCLLLEELNPGIVWRDVPTWRWTWLFKWWWRSAHFRLRRSLIFNLLLLVTLKRSDFIDFGSANFRRRNCVLFSCLYDRVESQLVIFLSLFRWELCYGKRWWYLMPLHMRLSVTWIIVLGMLYFLITQEKSTLGNNWLKSSSIRLFACIAHSLISLWPLHFFVDVNT